MLLELLYSHGQTCRYHLSSFQLLHISQQQTKYSILSLLISLTLNDIFYTLNSLWFMYNWKSIVYSKLRIVWFKNILRLYNIIWYYVSRFNFMFSLNNSYSNLKDWTFKIMKELFWC